MLRIVIFTHPTLTPYNDVLFRRLLADPEIDLSAIVIDEHPWKTTPLARRLREHGPGYLLWKIKNEFSDLAAGALWSIWRRAHPPRADRHSWDRLAAAGARLYRTPNIHSAPAVEFIRGLGADLGLICGGRIIKDAVTTLPRRGTLNIHKRKTPDYRGGGAIGYWELLDGAKEIGVTIHYAVARVDEGAVLAQRLIPIEPFDTLASLAIKAGVAGGDLYYEVVRDLARGRREALPQDLAAGKTYRGAGEYPEALFERARLRRRRAAQRARDPGEPLPAAAWRWVKYLTQYPLLVRRRNALIAAGQAPIVVLFYHRVAGDAANMGTTPLDTFVETVELIRRHYPIISLDEAARRLASGRNTEIAFVLTFDDGYAADLRTSIPYLRYFGIPATFFVSVGHVLGGEPFAHDLRRCAAPCPPLTVDELRTLEGGGISVGSHAWLHDDCGKVAPASGLHRAIVDSRRALGEILGRPPEHFAFPIGQKGVNISRESWELATQHYAVVCSAYSGFNFPRDGARHIKRWGNPARPVDAIQIMDGYTGLRDLLHANLWTWKTAAQDPF